MTSCSIQFRLIDPLSVHREPYKELHNLLFKNAEMSYAWLDWYHGSIGATNGRQGTRTYGAFAQDALVGIWSVEPKRLVTAAAKVIDVGRCFAVGVHPGYRRHGLFVNLSTYAIEQERLLGHYEYIIGFPQAGRPVLGGHFKAGWEFVQDVEPYHIDLQSIDSRTSKSQLRPITSFEGLDLSGLSGSFSVSSSYLDQRWLRHPDNCYLSFFHDNSYIVLKPYGGVCHILELHGKQSSVGVLLEAAKTLCRRHRWQELNMWCARNEQYRADVIKAGLSEGSAFVLPVLVIAVRINSTSPLTFTAGTHFQMGVEESY